MKKDYAEVFWSASAAERYDTVVHAAGSFSAAVAEREASWLRRFVRATFGATPPVQHDFACGTGRAIKALQGHVVAAYGYDTSKAMIARARGDAVEARLRVIDAGEVPQPASNATPAVVTIFRLLLNTGPDVRDTAIAFAARALPYASSGVLLIENHGNSRSLRHLVKPRHRGDEWFNELSHREVRELLARHGFRVESMHGFALLPRAAFRHPRLRRWAARIDACARGQSWLAPYSRCLIYVARRAS